MPRSVMGIIEFVVLALVLGLIVWLIWAKTPIPMIFKQIILWVVVIVLVLLLLHAFGVVGKDVQIPKIR